MTALTDRVALVTGASSGIGEATAVALAGRGVRVALAARRTERLNGIAQRIEAAGGRALAIAADVTDRDAVRRAVEETTRAFGGIDVLVNNAGIMPLAPMSRCRMDDWDAMVDVNVKGLLYGIGLVLPLMLERGEGHIINVSSVAGRRTFPGAAVYCGTKFAVHAISEGLRSELAEQAERDGNRIRVTVIAPGVVRTELPDSIRDERTRAASKAYYGSFAEPLESEDVAAGILYALEAPPHVDVNEMLLRPTWQVR
ncbi:MAG: SDR family oxidoreductase [Planctomycetota bacterium]|jgi:NADP-dependent 3-hydroxy acid dehydrogenase YdfG